MSLRNYIPKTKPALWTTDRRSLKPRSRAPEPVAPKAPRKRIASRSKGMTARMKIYNERKAVFLSAKPRCFACKEISAVISRACLRDDFGMDEFQRRNAILFRAEAAQRPEHDATQIHHLRGKIGPLLLEERFWRGVCDRAHHFIGEQPMVARAAGLLCEAGQWNKPEPL